MNEQIYYAFIESHEMFEDEHSVVFDVVEKKNHEQLVKTGNFAELPTELIHLRLNYQQLSKVYNFKHLYSGRWYRLILNKKNKEGVPCSCYKHITDSDRSSGYLIHLELLAPSNKTAKELKSTYSFNNLKNLDKTLVDKEQLKRFLETITPKGDFIGRVRNVGQGSCNSFIPLNDVNFSEEEFLYLALGGGFGPNKSTYPKDIEFKPKDNALHILCHWDMDHWISSEYNNELNTKVKWLAPKQKNVGPTHVIKAQQLIDNNKLTFWPESLTSISTSFLNIYKLPENKDRNYSGLVIATKTSQGSDKYFLYPGDAPFSRYSKLIQNLKIHAIAIPHHGGKMPFRAIINAPKKHVAICSYGRDNTYAHPYEHVKIGPTSTIQRYKKKNWSNWRETIINDQYFYSGTNKDVIGMLKVYFYPNVSFI
ncbi:hypothetical protein BCT41_06245 [Vibrio splendidus]|uniref:hypothetical protein n=1 Tax=Vibrio splendidus TaxID=29497 RepID=UPI000C8234D8|nr:hypothetical protein [Vibrio splendidus]PMN12812.1 hypothetical protein BCT41_06245 [Vibrio splendidus]